MSTELTLPDISDTMPAESRSPTPPRFQTRHHSTFSGSEDPWYNNSIPPNKEAGANGPCRKFKDNKNYSEIQERLLNEPYRPGYISSTLLSLIMPPVLRQRYKHVLSGSYQMTEKPVESSTNTLINDLLNCNDGDEPYIELPAVCHHSYTSNCCSMTKLLKAKRSLQHHPLQSYESSTGKADVDYRIDAL